MTRSKAAMGAMGASGPLGESTVKGAIGRRVEDSEGSFGGEGAIGRRVEDSEGSRGGKGRVL